MNNFTIFAMDSKGKHFSETFDCETVEVADHRFNQKHDNSVILWVLHPGGFIEQVNS